MGDVSQEIQAADLGDMQFWAMEKSSHAVEVIVRAIDALRRSDVDDEHVETAQFLLENGMYEAIKILSFCCEAQFKPTDVQAVRAEGWRGYEAVAVKYGLYDETTIDAKVRRLSRFIESIRQNLQISRADGRRELHELLLSCDLDYAPVDDIADLTEDLTMGKLNWCSYRKRVGRQLEALEDEVRRLEEERIDLDE